MAKKVKYTSWMQNGDGNPTPGQFDSPNGNVDNGGGAPSASKPVTVPSTGNDYSGWNWEQALVGVLGLQLPDRNDVTNQRWTAINDNSSGGSGLLRIFAAAWRAGTTVGGHKNIFVYLNPNLQQPGGMWDNYYFQPYTALGDATGGNYTGLQVDPKTFVNAADEVQGVISFYQSSAATFQGLSNDLAGDASAFKGQAGGAFAQLIGNLYQATNSVASQMTSPNNYATMISDAGSQVNSFVLSLWNALQSWASMLDHQPLGAIYQAMEDGGVITRDGSGNYQMANPSSTDSSFGDLTDDNTWIAIENAAKQLWLQSIQSALDPVAQSALSALVNSYNSAVSGDQQLNPPALTPIDPGTPDGTNNPAAGAPIPSLSAGDGSGLGGAGSGLGGAGSPGLATSLGGAGLGGAGSGLGGNGSPSLDTALGGAGMGGAGSGLGSPSLDTALGGAGLGGAGTGLGSPSLDTALGGPGSGGGGNLSIPGGPGAPALDTALGGAAMPAISAVGAPALDTALGGAAMPAISAVGAPALDTALGGAGTPALGTGLGGTGLATPGGISTALGGSAGGPGSVSLGTPQLSGLQSALASNGQMQSALQQALALAPPTGALHNKLTTALANNTKARNALQAAMNGSEPAATALQSALSSDGQAQSALRQALNLAPSKGPLHNAIEKALGDSNNTQTALNQSLSSGGIPESSRIHQALNSDNSVSGALHKALASSQVPSRGPLHSTLTDALSHSGQVRSALDRALSDGAKPSMSDLHQALSSNTALQSELRTALHQAPAHGALHDELMSALADSKNVGGQIHQAMAQAGIASEPSAGSLSSLANPAGGLTGPLSALGKNGLTASLGGAGGGGGGLSTALGGGVGGGVGGGLGGGVGGSAGLGASHGGAVAATAGLGGSSGASGTISAGGASGQAAAASAPGSGSSEVPMYSPMAGSGGMGAGGGQQNQERERSTWLAEDEDVWGTDPEVGPAVLGRDLFADDDEVDEDYDDFDEAVPQRSPQQAPRIAAR